MCWLQHSAQLWSYPTFLLIPLMGIACVECFAGYRAWRFLLGVNGAVLGFIVGVMGSMLLGAPMLVLIGAIAGAVAGAFLFAGIVRIGSFFFGFGSVASLTLLLGHLAGAPRHCTIALAAATGLAGAVAAIVACRPFMISIAAVAGAQQIASAWRAYHVPYGSFPLPDDVTGSESTTFIALTALGLLLQFCFPRRSQSCALNPDDADGKAAEPGGPQIPLLAGRLKA